MTKIVGGVILGTLAIILFLCQAEAQTGGKDKKKSQLPAGWNKLDLSAKQKNDMYGVMDNYKAKIKALDTQIKQLRAEEHKELVKLLTDGQKKQLIASLGLEIKPEEKKPEEKK